MCFCVQTQIHLMTLLEPKKVEYQRYTRIHKFIYMSCMSECMQINYYHLPKRNYVIILDEFSLFAFVSKWNDVKRRKHFLKIFMFVTNITKRFIFHLFCLFSTKLLHNYMLNSCYWDYHRIRILCARPLAWKPSSIYHINIFR